MIIHSPSSWGRVQQKAYSETLSQRGIKILDSIEMPAQDNNEWGTIVSKVASNKPEITVLLLNKNDISQFLQKAREQRVASSFFSSKNTYDSWRMNPKLPIFEGVCFSYPYEQLHENSEFFEKYLKTFGDEPRIFADASYDAGKILTEAKELATKSDRKLIDCLRSGVFKGIVGEYRYSPESSFAISKSSLLCIRQGQVEVEGLKVQ